MFNRQGGVRQLLDEAFSGVFPRLTFDCFLNFSWLGRGAVPERSDSFWATVFSPGAFLRLSEGNCPVSSH